MRPPKEPRANLVLTAPVSLYTRLSEIAYTHRLTKIAIVTKALELYFPLLEAELVEPSVRESESETEVEKEEATA